jgi:hypothetical protein
MQLVSPFPGSVAGGQSKLEIARNLAAEVAADPYAGTMDKLQEGMRNAQSAAAELFMAQPSGPDQDLVAARRHAIEGRQLLWTATTKHVSAHGVDHGTEVRGLATSAVASFDAALQILEIG